MKPASTATRQLVLPDETATLDLAARLAAAMPASAPLVLHLVGELGAGKTTLARGMLRQMGEQGPVRSPTYGLVAEYDTPRGHVVHLDLYRLQTPDELHGLGLPDLLPGSRLWLIEWPERGRAPDLPSPDLQVTLGVTDTGRSAELVAVTSGGQEWLRFLGEESR